MLESSLTRVHGDFLLRCSSTVKTGSTHPSGCQNKLIQRQLLESSHYCSLTYMQHRVSCHYFGFSYQRTATLYNHTLIHFHATFSILVSIIAESTFHLHLHKHTHPFNSPLSRTTRVSQWQKGKTNLDFTKERDNEWQWHQLGYMQVCISLQRDNHASTPSLSFFTGRMPFLPPNQQHQSTEGTYTCNLTKLQTWAHT